MDDLHFRVERDGRTPRTRQVLQVVDANAVRALSERALSLRRSHQAVRIDWVRVLLPNGAVVSDRAAQDQESDVPAALATPVYGDQKVRRLSLAGVGAGTIIDMAWTMEERAPARSGDFLLRWSMNGGIPVVRSRLIVDAPDGFTPKFAERNIRAPLVRRSEGVRDGPAHGVDGQQRQAFRPSGRRRLQPVAMSITVAPAIVVEGIARCTKAVTGSIPLSAEDAARSTGCAHGNGEHTRRPIRAVHGLRRGYPLVLRGARHRWI